MAFSNVQRDQIRTYMGMPKLFSQANAVLENAMDAIDGIADGGATEGAMVAVLNNLQAIDAQILANSNLMLATEVMDEVKFDAIRADLGLRKMGRYLINQIAIPLSMPPAVDFFSSPTLNPTPDITMHQYN